MKLQKRIIRLFIKVLLPLVSGIAIYAFWRGIGLLQTKPIMLTSVPAWVKYNLPDGLWFYALLSSLTFIWEGTSAINLVRWSFAALLLSLISEAAQAFGIIPGTFDWFDLVAYVVAGTFALIQNWKILKLPNPKILKNEN